MEHLWAPWRMTYIGSATGGDGCIFCAALASAEDRGTLVVHRGRLAFIILNAYPYASGHLMVATNRHGVSLDEATAPELAETMELVKVGVGALRAVYAPHGFNVGLNMGRVAGAGIPDHLHVHVVPRWNGDANFISVIGQTRVLPEALETTFDRLKVALSS